MNYLDEDIKELVIARIETLSSNKKVSFGPERTFTKTEMIELVREGDTIGQKIIAVEMSFLRSFKDGLNLSVDC